MKNTFGSSVALTIFGESHGEMIGAVIDGLAPGIEIDEEKIAKRLELRKSDPLISTKRREPDRVSIVSGVFNKKTTGTPVCLLIANEDKRSADYTKTKSLARPGHADFSARMKYHGFEDYRGGGHFSGRITAPIVAAGSIALDILEKKGITVGTHIQRLGDVFDLPFDDYEKQIKLLSEKEFAVISNEKGEEMKALISEAAKDGDSIGGVLETAICGVPCGVGEPWFDSVESVLSHALFSVPGVKGIQFGAGFDLVFKRGSEFNDEFEMKNGRVVTRTNHNGGINGGITNGMPITFRLAIKPTPSIFKEQHTVNIDTNENEILLLSGRHDPAIIHRARIVVDSVSALVICDLLASRYGTDFLGGEESR